MQIYMHYILHQQLVQHRCQGLWITEKFISSKSKRNMCFCVFVYVCTCTCVCACACAHVHMGICMHWNVHMHMCMHMHVHAWMCMNVRMRECAHAWIRMPLHVDVCMYVCARARVCACACVILMTLYVTYHCLWGKIWRGFVIRPIRIIKKEIFHSFSTELIITFGGPIITHL